MPTITAEQIPFRYRNEDSLNGVTRKTVKEMAAKLGVPETHIIHMALYAMATKILPQYERDDGALTDEQISKIREHSPDRTKLKLRASLFSKQKEEVSE
jgi:hypothetical protein